MNTQSLTIKEQSDLTIQAIKDVMSEIYLTQEEKDDLNDDLEIYSNHIEEIEMLEQKKQEEINEAQDKLRQIKRDLLKYRTRS